MAEASKRDRTLSALKSRICLSKAPPISLECVTAAFVPIERIGQERLRSPQRRWK
jgi:hypothetical protein